MYSNQTGLIADPARNPYSIVLPTIMLMVLVLNMLNRDWYLLSEK